MKTISSYLVIKFLVLLIAFLPAYTQAVTTTCGQAGPDIAYFLAEPSVWELSYPYYELDGEAVLSGASHGSAYSPPAGYPYIYLYFYNIQPGQSEIEGDSYSFAWAPGPEGGQYSGYDDCDYTINVPYCESSDPYNENKTSFGINFGQWITDAVNGGLSDPFVGCGVNGSPSVVGGLEVTEFDQCCESEQAINHSITATGNIDVNIPMLSCSSIPFAVWGFQVQANVDVSVSASANYGGSSNVCNEQEVPLEVIGSVGGSVGGSVSASFINQNVLSIEGGGTGPFGFNFQGPEPFDLGFSGCLGPVDVGLTLTYLWSETEFDVYQVPNSEFCL